MGHEIAGVVVAIGSKVIDHVVGDRVAVGAQCYSCLQKSCKACGQGM